jgi:hypothetical protein
MERSYFSIVLRRIIGFVIFLVLLGIANILAKYVDFKVFSEVVGFFNTNLILLLTMMVIALVNELFWRFYFPFNILGPVTASGFTLLIASFIYKFWIFVNTYLLIDITIPIGTIYIGLFWAVLLLGYALILFRKGKPKHASEREVKEKVKEREEKGTESPIGWDDVGDQFKMIFYNIARSINRKFERKDDKDDSNKFKTDKKIKK